MPDEIIKTPEQAEVVAPTLPKEETTESVEIIEETIDPNTGAKFEVEKSLPDRGLTLKQELFCYLFAQSQDCFGNGTQSYIEAYKPKRVGNWYNSAKASAYDNLTKPYIIERINDYLDLDGFNDANVDKQHNFLINQYADLKTKRAAIRDYNELKQRIKKSLGVEDDEGNQIATITINVHRPEEETASEPKGDNGSDSDTTGTE